MRLSKFLLEIEPIGIDDGLEIGIGIFSLLLFAISITAYRNILCFHNSLTLVTNLNCDFIE